MSMHYLSPYRVIYGHYDKTVLSEIAAYIHLAAKLVKSGGFVYKWCLINALPIGVRDGALIKHHGYVL